MTPAEAQTRIAEALRDWRTVGQVARRLGLLRSSVQRQVSRMREFGELEGRIERFWRNGDYRVGRVYRLVRIECAPVLEDDDRRHELLASIFECAHGVEMCEPCSTRGRRCEHRCVECGPQMVFSEMR